MNFRRRILPAFLLALCVLPATAADLAPGAGVTFYQISYGGTPSIANTPVGWMEVDLNALRSATGITSGYLNVATPRGWVVRNLPVIAESVYPYSRVNTRLDLGSASGVAVTQLTATVRYTDSLLTSLTAVPASVYPVTGMTMKIGGGTGVTGGGPATPPNLTDILFADPASNDTIIQFDHPNEEAADNQCAPMSVANSLQYLRNTRGLQLPQSHVPGIKGDASLVGQLDTAGDRPVVDRQHGSGQWLMRTKLNYVARFNLGARVATSHWGVSGADSGASNISATVNGVTATSSGKGSRIDIDQLMQALREGQDCEMVYSWDGPPAGAHAVDIVGAGRHNGQPWLLYASDVIQADTAIPDADRRGAGPAGLEFEYLGPPNASGVYTTPGGNRIDQVVCEKYVPPPATLTVTSVTDPAGHGPFVDGPPSTVNITVSGTAMTVSGAASWLPLAGTIAADGSFSLASTATVAGYQNVANTFTGRLQGSGYSGRMTIGAGGELPSALPIAWDVAIAPPAEPATVAMRLNGFRHRLDGRSTELWRPSVSVKTGSQPSQTVDWWLVANANGAFYHFDLATMSWRPGVALTHAGPLTEVPYLALPYLNLPSGSYEFHFGFDTVPDGNLTMEALTYETLRVTAQ